MAGLDEKSGLAGQMGFMPGAVVRKLTLFLTELLWSRLCSQGGDPENCGQDSCDFTDLPSFSALATAALGPPNFI